MHAMYVRKYVYVCVSQCVPARMSMCIKSRLSVHI